MRRSRRATFEDQGSAFERARDRADIRADLTISSPLHVGLTLPEPPELSWSDYRPDPRGCSKARAAIAADIGADPEHLVLTASTSEAYTHLFKLLCDPGDDILIPRPSYPLLEVLAKLEGVDARPYPLRFAGSWMLDRNALADAIGPRTRAIVIVQPNNPTGSSLCPDDLTFIADLGLPIISDEVFAGYAHGARTSLADAPGALRFILDGLSKSAGLPHAKLGWIRVEGSDAPAALAALEHIADALLSPSGPVQDAAALLLKVGRARRRVIDGRLHDSLTTLHRAATDQSFSVLPVNAGWNAVLRLPSTQSDEAWAIALLERGVLVQPGYLYDMPGEAHIIVSLLTPPAALHQGLRELTVLVPREHLG